MTETERKRVMQILTNALADTCEAPLCAAVDVLVELERHNFVIEFRLDGLAERGA